MISISVTNNGLGPVGNAASSGAENAAIMNGGASANGEFEVMLQGAVNGQMTGEQASETENGANWFGALLANVTNVQSQALTEEDGASDEWLTAEQLLSLEGSNLNELMNVQSAQVQSTQQLAQAQAVSTNADLQTESLLQMAQQLLAKLEKGPEVVQQMIANDDGLQQALLPLLTQLSESPTQDADALQANLLNLMKQANGAQDATVSVGQGDMTADMMKLALQKVIQDLSEGKKDLHAAKHLAAFQQAGQSMLQFMNQIQVVDPNAQAEMLGDVNGKTATTQMIHAEQSDAGANAESQSSSKSNEMLSNNKGNERVLHPHFHPLMHLQPPSQALANMQMPVQNVPIQQFANEMDQWIMKNFQIHRGQGVHEAVFKLFPEQLGQVDVSVKFQNGQVIAHFMTETIHGRDAIENQLQQLKVQLQQQGLNVERIEVSKHNDTNNGFQHQQQQKQSQEQQRSNQHSNGRGKAGKIDGIDGPMVLDQQSAQSDVQRQQLMWNRRIPIGAALNIQA